MISDVGRWVGQRGSDVRSAIFESWLFPFLFRLKGHSKLILINFAAKVRSCYRVKPGGPKKFLFEVKTITKSPENGIA